MPKKKEDGPTRLRSAKRVAGAATSARGHRLRWGDPVYAGTTFGSQLGQCVKCDCIVLVAVGLEFGGPHLYGSATTNDCIEAKGGRRA